MPHSVENHPVYGQGGAGPSHNRSGGYRFRLYIDGEWVDAPADFLGDAPLKQNRDGTKIVAAKQDPEKVAAE